MFPPPTTSSRDRARNKPPSRQAELLQPADQRAPRHPQRPRRLGLVAARRRQRPHQLLALAPLPLRPPQLLPPPPLPPRLLHLDRTRQLRQAQAQRLLHPVARHFLGARWRL